MQHVEFIHTTHFDHNYLRQKPPKALSRFIDFFWETKFDALFLQHPQGFSDALFPNVGYTYLVNLGTSFTMQLGEQKFSMKSDGFLPRHKHMVCYHSRGNQIFGIKFKISPVLFEKKINFSEYREYIFPLAYLMDRDITTALKAASDFQKRVDLLSAYYTDLVQRYEGSMKQVNVVTNILDSINRHNNFNTSVEQLAQEYDISTRTLQRYFEATTSIPAKQALQILRIRKAVNALVCHPESFSHADFSYYDHSHFYKHLKQFLDHNSISLFKPHLQLLQGKFYS